MRKDILRLKILEQGNMTESIKMTPEDLVFSFECFRDFGVMLLEDVKSCIEMGTDPETIQLMLKIAVFPEILHNTIVKPYTDVCRNFPGKTAIEVEIYFKNAYVNNANEEIRNIITNYILFPDLAKFGIEDINKIYDFYYNNPHKIFNPLDIWIWLEADNWISSDKNCAFIEMYNLANSPKARMLINELYMML